MVFRGWCARGGEISLRALHACREHSDRDVGGETTNVISIRTRYERKREKRGKRGALFVFFFTPHPFIVFYLRPNSNERTNERTKIIKFVIQGGTRSATPRSREKRVNASTVKRIHLHSFTVTRGNKTSPRPIRIPGGKETRIANRKKENLRERVRKRKGEESCGSF